MREIGYVDYLMDAGTLKIIKKNKSFDFTNLGILKLPIEDIFRGGNSKPRNPHMQTMLSMVGFGDNAGSGFPTILATWQAEGGIRPELLENTVLNQVTLALQMKKVDVAEEQGNFVKKNDRSLTEVLNEVNFKRIQPLIPVLENRKEITPKEAEGILGKSTSTTYRYLSILVDAGVLIKEGNTNKIIYKLV